MLERRPQQRGITITELLITLALIGLLISLISPALLSTRDKAETAICMNQLKQLHTGWYAFSLDHQGRLVPSETDPRNTWVLSGHQDDAITKGLLYPYIGSINTYRCPADYTAHTRSYSINNYLGGAFIERLVTHHLDDIRKTSQTLVMLDENDARPDYGYNPGSWLNVPSGNQWLDRPGIFHPRSTAMVFADGHATTRIWEDNQTLSLSNVDTIPSASEDLAWIQARLGIRR